MPEKDKKLMQRWGHGAAAFTINSDYMEVLLFGGWKEGLPIADPVVLRFGKHGHVLINTHFCSKFCPCNHGIAHGKLVFTIEVIEK